MPYDETPGAKDFIDADWEKGSFVPYAHIAGYISIQTASRRFYVTMTEPFLRDPEIMAQLLDQLHAYQDKVLELEMAQQFEDQKVGQGVA